MTFLEQIAIMEGKILELRMLVAKLDEYDVDTVFDMLPREVFHLIADHFDIDAATNLRAVNHEMCDNVNDWALSRSKKQLAMLDKNIIGAGVVDAYPLGLNALNILDINVPVGVVAILLAVHTRLQVTPTDHSFYGARAVFTRKRYGNVRTVNLSFGEGVFQTSCWEERLMVDTRRGATLAIVLSTNIVKFVNVKELRFRESTGGRRDVLKNGFFIRECYGHAPYFFPMQSVFFNESLSTGALPYPSPELTNRELAKYGAKKYVSYRMRYNACIQCWNIHNRYNVITGIVPVIAAQV